MAVTYGFFNSINDDRLYNADQMSHYFKGLVTDGVYEHVDSAMQVLATTGMVVRIGTGRGIIDCKWINVDAPYDLTINTSHVTLNRYTAICVHLDATNRLIELITYDGENATNPVKPVPESTLTDKYLVLAYVYVGAGVASISQSNITDTRADTNICGWVTGLIQQVNTATLFLQWQTAYEEFYAQMTSDFQGLFDDTEDDCQDFYDQMTVGFNAWFSTLTDQLNVNTYVENYKKRVVYDGTSGENVISLDMVAYEYEAGDIIEVYINGLYSDEGFDYTLDTSLTTPTVTTTATQSGTVVSITVKKSKIGYAIG